MWNWSYDSPSASWVNGMPVCHSVHVYAHATSSGTRQAAHSWTPPISRQLPSRWLWINPISPCFLLVAFEITAECAWNAISWEKQELPEIAPALLLSLAPALLLSYLRNTTSGVREELPRLSSFTLEVQCTSTICTWHLFSSRYKTQGWIQGLFLWSKWTYTYLIFFWDKVLLRCSS